MAAGAVRPVVDVGVVTYNTASVTADALRRLLDDDQGVEVRVLVRDNGSHDGTVELLAERVPEADVEAGEDNLGFAAGMNQLLERSTAPWFFALNADAWPEPGAIRRLLDVALAHPEAAAVAPRLLRPDGTLEHSTHRFPSARLAAATAVGGRVGRRRAEALLLEGAWLHDRPAVVDWAVGAALLMRRDAIDAIGRFDERFFMYAEDLEWCWRAHRRGWEIRFEPSAVVRHIGNASGASRYGRHRTAAYLRNTYRFYRREHGLAASAAYRALNLAGSARLALVLAARGDRSAARFWWRQLPVHALPASGADGPPSDPS